MKILLLINLCFSSIDSLPSESDLFNSIDTYYDAVLEVELKEFERADKRKYLNFMPSLGTGYSGNGSLRPSISFNFSSIVNYFNEKERINKMRESVVLNNKVSRKAQKRALRVKLNLLYQYEQDVIYEKEVLIISKQLHEIVKSKYSINKALPSELLKSKLSILKQEKLIRDKVFKLKEFISDVLIIAEY